MAGREGPFCETSGVTVSRTTEAERTAAGARDPGAELEGALKVIRAVSEVITEPMNQTLPRLQMLERRLNEALQRGDTVDQAMSDALSRICRMVESVCVDLRRFQHVERLCVRSTPIGDVMDLETSIQPGGEENGAMSPSDP
jgi:hypothetical protein